MGEERRQDPEIAHADTLAERSASDVTEQGSYLGRARDPGTLPSAPAIATARYDNRGFIAAGGMGEVWRVYDRTMQRLLAMKVLAVPYLDDPRARRRFLDEARITANLQHPGIVAVHDMGTLDDGRPFFTMKEVRGRTYQALIAELHRAATPPSERRAALREMVDVMLRVCEAVGYAHSAGTVHRDLKPQNVMVGRFGEVQVMDWGLAFRIGERSGERLEVAGTFAYMAPEQAQGDPDRIGPWSDVYALGAILYELLSGAPPPAADPPAPPASDDPDVARLSAICRRAMALEPSDRYADAQQLTQALRDWQNETRRRSRALARIAEADAHSGGIAGMRQRIAALRREAARLLEDVQPYDPIERKAPAWRLEDEADELEHRLAVDEIQWQQRLRAALSEEPDLPEAHDRLADHYKERLDDADERGDPVAIRRAEALLRIHDRGRYRRHVDGRAQLTLATSPEGASATLYRYEPVDRRLVPRLVGELGETPLHALTLTAGSYLVILRKEGHHDVRYPVHLRRAGHWDGIAPGEAAPHPIALPTLGSLTPDEIYVPAGWFVAGGDPSANEPLPRARVWVDAFVIQRHPVTRAAYVSYLNALCDAGRADEARRRAPKLPGEHGEASTHLAWPSTPEGRYQLDPEVKDPAQARWPITLVHWHDARAYAQWLSQQTGHAWRLPGELEWEKAARGVDARRFPWGNHFDAMFACVGESHRDTPSPAPVDAYDADRSPYGVRGMAGNVRDWCNDAFRRNGPISDGGRAVTPRTDEAASALRCARGGAWLSGADLAASASRFAGPPDFVYRGLGFRLVRPRDTA